MKLSFHPTYNCLVTLGPKRIPTTRLDKKPVFNAWNPKGHVMR